MKKKMRSDASFAYMFSVVDSRISSSNHKKIFYEWHYLIIVDIYFVNERYNMGSNNHVLLL